MFQWLSQLKTEDQIQLALLLVAIGALVYSGWQTHLQNRVFTAQLVRDRFEMYWRTYEPVSEELLRQFGTYPEDWMSKDTFDKHYAGADKLDAQRRYLYMSRVYEYLAFAHYLNTGLKIKDPISDDWHREWVKSLAESEDFARVHECYAAYYPRFAQDRVDKVLPRKAGFS